ncbi:MAG TPA: sigma-70 family RNA polymerase sigma factor [Casimicrobiaceae bacterium]|nr:sigma-70 family RNA polymerase sigma factor [Casimicrobiaceae bacterium]
MLGKRRVIKAIAARRTSADPDDAALVGQIATGDIPAFEALYRSYYPRLTRFLEQMTRRPQLTDEILNDTMLIVWRKAATFDLSSKVSTWIIGIALRRGLKALARADDARDSAPDDVAASAEPGPEAQLLRRELRKQLGRALMSLPVEQRAVVELSFYHGYTYREIATIVDCPVDTVKTRMFHARRRLKVLLAEHREEAA